MTIPFYPCDVCITQLSSIRHHQYPTNHTCRCTCLPVNAFWCLMTCLCLLLQYMRVCRYVCACTWVGGVRAGDRSRGPGQLPLLSRAAVSVRPAALRGMRYPGGPILLSDPPDSYRPPPRLSVAAAPAPAAGLYTELAVHALWWRVTGPSSAAFL